MGFSINLVAYKIFFKGYCYSNASEFSASKLLLFTERLDDELIFF